MAIQIYKTSGVKGFYPLIGLSAFGMFARGIAISHGKKIYEALISNDKCETSNKLELSKNV
ncbi:hypothetical protein [Legionella cincinnatiensis]|nr:hypothetical protein [Legionella cincinnatiensis]